MAQQEGAWSMKEIKKKEEEEGFTTVPGSEKDTDSPEKEPVRN